jgi:hypothetical protein
LTTNSDFASYSTYTEVKSPILRAWNRLNTIFNMKELLGNDKLAVRYMKKFPREDQLAIWALSARIIQNGYENTRREIMRDNNV